jgi:hypothetical protein
MSLKTYDSKLIVITFGPLIISGYAEDSIATLTPESEIFTAKVGADGQTTRSRSNNDNYKCSLRLMQTSDSQSQIQALTLRNSILSGITWPFKLISPTTRELYESSNAYLERNPDAEFGREAGEREYTFYLPSCKINATEVLTSMLGFGI